LFVISDELRFDTMACYGNHAIQTPNLNALGAESFVFENAYVSQPLCTPARSTLLTGLDPQTSGIVENSIPLGPDIKTIAQMVSLDYRRGLMGKIHIGDEVIAHHGFETRISIDDNYHVSDPKHLERMSDYYHFLRAQGFEPDEEDRGRLVFNRERVAAFPVELTKASFLGREASRFIETNVEKPWLLCVGFFEPHSPMIGPYDDLHPRDDLHDSPVFLKSPPDNASMYHRTRADLTETSHQYDYDLSKESEWRDLKARYWGNITLMDRALGNILRTLEETGQADDTIVVVTSEHGEMMGDHRCINMFVMYQESIKVPLLVRVPWLGRETRHIPGHFGHVDLVPTLLELMNEETPEALDGESRAPVLRGDETLDQDVIVQWTEEVRAEVPEDMAAYLETLERRYGPEVTPERIQELWSMPRRTVISADNLKLNLASDDVPELYDLNADPHETTNVIARPEYRARIDEMTARLHAWQDRYNDPAPRMRA
jgi:arylsulfatase A-like enzyme